MPPGLAHEARQTPDPRNSHESRFSISLPRVREEEMFRGLALQALSSSLGRVCKRLLSVFRRQYEALTLEVTQGLQNVVLVLVR